VTRKITAQTRVAGVIGNPVRHSLSPIIHNAWIEAAGIDAVYLAFEPPPERFEAFVNGLRGGVIRGLNVTMPFKERAFDLGDWVYDLDLDSHATKSANLLLFDESQKIQARSTDGIGVLAALEQVGVTPGRGPIVVLGAGGAARSAAYALRRDGAGDIRVVNRSLERAQAIVDIDPDRTFAYSWDQADEALEDASIVINATSLGMKGQPPLDLDLRDMPETAVVMEMVYHPLVTPLLDRARRRGHTIVDGLSMLIGQAIPSFEAFFGQPPPADVDVRALCEAALAART
jgi:shikimate dehydrogenase